MLRNDLYYFAKPFLPTRMRLALRRWHAKRILRRIGDVWPILESAGQKPEGWPGWPDGKQFAFVLTHDVEGRRGLANVRRLAELEMEFGFRSSFNFVPEGEYRVPADLRHWLTDNGFEVGVHDLHHDGHLYRSRETFRRRAARINHYLADWGAVGFRSGFMLHRLDWLHDLNIAYDSSTFDTDPFEPQPDGVHTIFPFWVPRPGLAEQRTEDSHQDTARSTIANLHANSIPPSSALHRPFSTSCPPSSVLCSPSPGYVELPYTLPQDSTLFLLLREQSPKVWLRKVDWIANRGGMVLQNLHPDYLAFDSPHLGFDVTYYRECLRQVRDRHANAFWPALPHEVARFAEPHRLVNSGRRPLRIAMVSHSFYENDNRVMRYAASLAERGDHVEVLSLKARRPQPSHEVRDGVRLSRLQPRYSNEQAGQLRHLCSVSLFTLHASLRLAYRHLRCPYDLIHAHNIPDFVVFAAWLPKLTGAKVILDIHDLVPELYASRFSANHGTATIRRLEKVERMSCHFANHVIVSNHLWRNTLVHRSVPAEKCSVFINHADPRIFSARPRTRTDDRLVLLFPGTLQWHQGLDVAIRAFSRVASLIPEAEFHIYGTGPEQRAVRQLAIDLHVEERVMFKDFVPINRVAEVMANADLGVVPKRASTFGNSAYSTKIMEFMTQGVPVVISRTHVDSYYFTPEVATFFESENDEALAEAILALWKNPERRRVQAEKGLAYAAEHSWTRRRESYFNLIDALAASGATTPVL